MKLGKMLLIKLANDYFSGILGEFSDNFPKICKSTENLRKMILDYFVKNNFSENCRQILGECSLHFRFCYQINYLLTGCQVLLWNEPIKLH